MFPEEINMLAQQVIDTLIDRKMTIATAESCTGGLIGGALTEIPGSSAAVYGGFVTYANAAKMAMIDVPGKMLASYGSVSEQTARAMAEGALSESETDIAIAVTGIAGPGGGTIEKPVGLVHFACATMNGTFHRREQFTDKGRPGIRAATVTTALEMVLQALRSG